MPFIQGTLILLIAFYLLVSVVGDHHIVQVTRAEILAIRLPLLVVLFGALVISVSKSRVVRPDVILAVVVSAASVTSSYVATLDPDASFRIVASHLGFGIIAVAIASRFSSIVVITSLLLVLPNAVLVGYAGRGALLATADLFLLLGASLILFLGYMSDQRRRQLFKAKAELTRIAKTDGLTEVLNRRFFIETADAEVVRSQRYRYPFSCMVLDIDGLEKVNDAYGQQAGNAVLQEMTQTISMKIREIDVLGRMGGDEFAVALPQTGVRAAMSLAERIRSDLAALEVEVGRGRITFTVSIGVAWLTSNDHSVMPILKRADEALYRSKQSGPNRAFGATCNEETPRGEGLPETEEAGESQSTGLQPQDAPFVTASPKPT